MERTRAHEKLLDAAVSISLDAPTAEEKAFMARQLVQATLPHRDPKDAPIWSRSNGNLTLSIRSGWKKDPKTGQQRPIGYPYGTIPRLLMFWATSEAIRTKSRRLELGRSLSDFMQELGLNPDNGSHGAKRSDARRLKDQMERLFRAIISFDYTEGNGNAWLDMQVAPEGMVWWDEKAPDQPSLFESWIELGDKFFQAITEAPIPVDMRALKALKNSPLALDLYTWATYTSYNVSRTGKPRSVSWDLLHKQIGADYNDAKDFKRKALGAFRKIQTVYPQFRMQQVRGGIAVLPSSAEAIAAKTPKKQLAEPTKEQQLRRAAAEILDGGKPYQPANDDYLSERTLERAKSLVEGAGTGWCFDALQKQFYLYARQRGIPKNPNGAFIGFVKRKITKRP
jgi:Plasmid encoded RepA protein